MVGTLVGAPDGAGAAATGASAFCASANDANLPPARRMLAAIATTAAAFNCVTSIIVLIPCATPVATPAPPWQD